MTHTIAHFRRVNPAIVAAQCLAKEPLHEGIVKKELAMALKRAAPVLKIAGTSYQILDILLGLVRQEDLKSGGKPLVAISNEKLAQYTMRSTRTVSRCIKRLVEAGILSYADSPNGRRFVRRDQSGAVDYGYGLDLTPACNRLTDLQDMAAEYQERLKLEKQARRHVVSRARAAKDLAIVLGEDASELLAGIELLLEQPLDPISRAEAIEYAYREMLELAQNMSCLGDINGVSISNTTPSHSKTFVVDKRHSSNELSINCENDNDRHRIVEDALEKKEDAQSGYNQQAKVQANTLRKTIDSLPSPALSGVSIGLLNQACTSITELLAVEFCDWRSLLNITEDLRHLIGLSEDGWHASCSGQSKYLAAACLAVVAEKALRDPEAITRPGGYFRAMIDRANEGKLNLQKSIFGLIPR